MFASLIRWGSRTTYRGSKGSGAGSSTRTSATSSPNSRPTFALAAQSGQTFKRSQRGLYDGKTLQSGHNVPKSRQKTARTWQPNVQSKRIWSDTLNKFVRARVTTSALRSIDKMGGLDYYLANAKDGRLGEWGRSLRDTLALKIRSDRMTKIKEEGRLIAQLGQSVTVRQGERMAKEEAKDLATAAADEAGGLEEAEALASAEEQKI